MRETSLRRRALRLLAVCSLVLAAGSGLSAQSGDLRLVEAVKRQDTVAVRVLVSEADVNATQADGATALHWAAYRDDLATARLLIGAGAKILGNIRIGEGAKIGAGSVVLDPVEPHCTVAGVPARIVGRPTSDSPALEMNHRLNCDEAEGLDSAQL